MGNRDLGDLGEQTFALWAAQRRIVANPSIKDKGGWDFHIQLPPSKDSNKYPLDERPPEITCMVQVKATDDNKGRIDDIKLSNWERMAKSALPYFFLVLEFACKNNAQQAYFIHVDKYWIEKTLKRLREVKKEEAGSIHKKYMSLIYSEEHKLDSLNGEGLEKAIRKHVGSDSRIYFEQKSKWIKTGFLDKIGYPGHKWYAKIDKLYVPPVEYEGIQRTLKEKRIVFITGSPEYGKTYTAVRLMWECYNEGYEPVWIKGGSQFQRDKVAERLENIITELKHGHIIYFEDPFGKIKYEKREGLEREIGTIIDCVKQVEDVFVIITSREEVFKEFEEEKVSGIEFRGFEKNLNIKKSSYNYEKRKEILLRISEAENCKWFEDVKLKDFIINYIKDESILSTTLSIKDFVVATFNIAEKDKLEEILREKSKETVKSFSNEIKNMTEDKILFLSFLIFSSYQFNIDFIRDTYQELVEKLKIRDAWKFEKILDWFKDDKINTYIKYSGFNRGFSLAFGSKNIPDKAICIEFSHPAYYKALEYFLFEGEHSQPIHIRNFIKLLIHLSQKDESVMITPFAITRYYNKFPKDVQNLLFTLSEKPTVAQSVALAIAYNYDILPEDARDLFFTLFKKYDTVGAAIWLAFDPDNKFSRHLKAKMKDILYKKYQTPEALSEAVARNLNQLPETFRMSVDYLRKRYIEM